MKIGIISINMYSKNLNFACPLHTWAFQQFLAKNYIDSTVIDYKPVYYDDHFDLRHPYESYRDKYEKLLEKKAEKEREGLSAESVLAKLEAVRGQMENYQALYREREIRYDKFQKFIRENYIKTETCYNAELLEVEDPGFDCYICVTDVIWRVIKNKGFDRAFFLDSSVMKGKYKIAYSASRGVFEGYTDKQQEEFLRMIEDIDEISVREDSLREWIEDYSEKDAVTVLDPVLLHDGEFWKSIAVEPEEKGYVLLYYVMEKAADTIRNAVQYAKQHNLDIVELSDRPFSQNIEGVRHIVRYDIGPEEWLGYIRHAECIFTNSFHACCFSILFQKLFYVGNRNGDKVSCILKTFGLTGQRLKKEEDIEDMPARIDYNKVMVILKEKRKKSEDFIFNAIHHAEEQTKTGKISENGKAGKVGKKVCAGKTKKRKMYPIRYHSGITGERLDWNCNEGIMEFLKSGAIEHYVKTEKLVNDGTARLKKNPFKSKGYIFRGWLLRIRSGNQWYWYMEDGTLGIRTDYNGDFDEKRKIFSDCAQIPCLPIAHIDVAVAEAVWEKNAIRSIYCCGKKKVKNFYKNYVTK